MNLGIVHHAVHCQVCNEILHVWPESEYFLLLEVLLYRIQQCSGCGDLCQWHIFGGLFV